jgi:thiopeptide-type bacteriocin biosynthesis protein
VHLLCSEINGSLESTELFFLRYTDPDPHLRLRFRGSSEWLTSFLFPRLCGWAQDLLQHGKCFKYAFDTYEREVERYGGLEAIGLAEALFAADSRAVIGLLASKCSIDRIFLTVQTIDDLLDALGLDAAARLVWLKHAVTSRNEVADEYRMRREELLAALSNQDSLSEPIRNALSIRRAVIERVRVGLAEAENQQTLTQPLSKVYESFVHMHCNRLGNSLVSERRVLGLLLRAREAIAHKPKVAATRCSVALSPPIA